MTSSCKPFPQVQFIAESWSQFWKKLCCIQETRNMLAGCMLMSSELSIMQQIGWIGMRNLANRRQLVRKIRVSETQLCFMLDWIIRFCDKPAVTWTWDKPAFTWTWPNITSSRYYQSQVVELGKVWKKELLIQFIAGMETTHVTRLWTGNESGLKFDY